MLSDLLSSSRIVNKIEDLQETLDLGKLPVFLPSTVLFKENPLENSWDVTSDSIAVYFAGLLNTNCAVLISDVDGVFTCDPKTSSGAKLIKQFSAQDLLKMNKRTSVDKFLPKLLLQMRMTCLVVNGLYPERVEAILNGRDTTCTLITSKPQ
jgi:hypothetical protein